jgi:hypothetical protein
VDDDGQEGLIDLEAAAVFDEPRLLELVHGRSSRARVERRPRLDLHESWLLTLSQQPWTRLGEAHAVLNSTGSPRADIHAEEFAGC